MFKETAITQGIKISVEVFYEPHYSKPHGHQYVFSYRITIENCSPHTVQLLRRHWFIFDSNGTKREVEGEGVIGKQPTIHPNQKHQYASWSPLRTTVGKMYGTYLMKRLIDKEQFYVRIPEFNLIVPAKLN